MGKVKGGGMGEMGTKHTGRQRAHLCRSICPTAGESEENDLLKGVERRSTYSLPKHIRLKL
jgi:hypothetical protein